MSEIFLSQPPHITVFGASGRTGLAIVSQAIAHGYRVTAYVRPSSREISLPDRTHTVIGELSDTSQVRQALHDRQATIIAFGPRSTQTPPFCADATRTIVTAMEASTNQRLVCITGAMIGDYPAQRRWGMQLMVKAFERQQSEHFADRMRQEAIVTQSGLDWTLVKPPRLTNGDGGEKLQVGEDMMVGMLNSVTRGQLAQLCLELCTDQTAVRQRLFVKSR